MKMKTKHTTNNSYNSLNTKNQDYQTQDKAMRIIRFVMRFAGTFIIVSVILAYVHSLYWLLFTLFVGLNLFQYSFTKFCPLEIILKRIIK